MNEIIWTLERNFIKAEEWELKVPAHVLDIVKQDSDYPRIPIGIGHHEIFGWYILCSAGQGPFVVYMEHLDEWDKLT